MSKIAFFGCGLMGEPMAGILLRAGYQLIAFNRTVNKMDSLAKFGAEVTDNAGEAMHKADIFITMLSDYKAIKEVMIDDQANRFKDKTFIQMSTIATDESLILKNIVEKSGGDYMEAPVLGSIPQVTSKSLMVLFGGTKIQYGKWRTLLENFGEKPVYLGEVGKASAIKLAFNQLIASLTTSFALSLAYVKEKKIDIGQFMTILRKSALYAPTFDKKLNSMMERNFSPANFPVKHLLKDINIIIKEFSKVNLDFKPLLAIESILIQAIRKDFSELDYSALYNIIHPKNEDNP